MKGGKRDRVFIHSKTGTIRADDGSSVAQGSGTPDRLRQVCETSLENLGIETLDAFCLSRVDPTVPIEETVGAMARLVEEGKTRFIALSEAAAGTLRRAMKVHPLVSLQYEFSLWTRDVEGGHIEACDALGLGLMAYAPLGYGFLTGTVGGRDALEEGDTRHKFPRFSDENAAANRERLTAIRKVADAHGATPAQVCIAWVLARGGNVFPIPGCKRRTHLEENLKALDIRAHGGRPRRAGCRVPAGRGRGRPLSARRHGAGESVGPHPAFGHPLPEGEGLCLATRTDSWQTALR